MDIFVFLLVLFIVYKIDIRSLNDNNDYLSLENCVSLRGIFALSVIYHHISQCVDNGILFHYVYGNMGYLAVSIFFFLSGYGLQKSNLKRNKYYKNFLIFRGISIAIPYIGIGIIYYCVLHSDQNFFEEIIKLFSFSSIVSNSWYIIAILSFYIFFYLMMRIFNTKRDIIPYTTLIFCFLWQLIFYKLGFGIWVYNSIFAIALGSFWANYEKNIFNFIQGKTKILFLIFSFTFLVLNNFNSEIISLITLIFGNCNSYMFVQVQNVTSIFFVLSIIFFIMLFTIKNSILNFIGQISFELYLIHGLFISIYKRITFLNNHEICFTFFVLISSIFVAFILNKIFSFAIKNIKHFITKIITASNWKK